MKYVYNNCIGNLFCLHVEQKKNVKKKNCLYIGLFYSITFRLENDFILDMCFTTVSNMHKSYIFLYLIIWTAMIWTYNQNIYQYVAYIFTPSVLKKLRNGFDCNNWIFSWIKKNQIICLMCQKKAKYIILTRMLLKTQQMQNYVRSHEWGSLKCKCKNKKKYILSITINWCFKKKQIKIVNRKIWSK